MMRNYGLYYALFVSIFVLITSGFTPAFSQGKKAENKAIFLEPVEDQIGITTGFSGTDITLFGLQKQQGDLAIVLRSPNVTATLKKRGEIAGLWILSRNITFEDVPAYYAVAANKPLEAITDDSALLKNMGIGLDYLDFKTRKKYPNEIVQESQAAFIQTQQIKGLYTLKTETITYVTPELFRISFHLPASIPIGEYQLSAYLFRGGKIVDSDSKMITVAHDGFNAELKGFALNKPWLYALLIIVIAAFSAWLATALLRRE